MQAEHAERVTPRPLRSRVRPLVNRTQPRGIHVGIALRGRERRMPEHLLDGTQISPTLQEVSRRRVPQPMGCDVVNTGARSHLVHH